MEPGIDFDFTGFVKILKELFPEITDEKIEMFSRLGELYSDWNAKINVISRKDIGQLYLHHVLHSLAIAGYIKEQMPEVYKAASCGEQSADGGAKVSILDLGTGGGFPGIPLAIMFPGASFTLCDSIGKKITVAAGVAESLGLSNVKTVNARAEDLPEKFDYVVSRAVTSLDRFMPWVKGKYRNGILYLKGGDIAEEISVAMRQSHIPSGHIRTWKIEDWAGDSYFNEKMVIHIPAK